MTCKHFKMNHARWLGPKPNMKTLLLVLLLIFVCGWFLSGWMTDGVAAEAQKEAVESQNEAGEVRDQMGETQGETAETPAPAEEEKGTFDSIKGVFSSWGHKAGIKKEKLSVKYDMRKLRGKIDEDYQELGRVFFALFREGAPDIMNDPELKSVLGAIVEKQAELEKLEARLAELRAEDGGDESEEEAVEAPQDTSSPAEDKPAE